MARTPEGHVKAAVKALLRGAGAYFFMPVQNGMGTVGVPDFIVCLEGKFVAIETKAPGKRGSTTPNQRKQLGAISRAGGVAVVVDSTDPAEIWATLAGGYMEVRD